MAQQKKISDFTLDELRKKEKTIRGIVIGTGIVSMIAAGVLLYSIIKSERYELIAVVVALTITPIPSSIVLSRLRAEIKSREEQL